MPIDAYELRRLLSALLPGVARRGRYAERPFVGYLEEPRPGQRIRGDVLRVHGWLFCRGSAIRQLTVTLDGGAEQPVQHEMPRPDLAVAFAGDPSAAVSGIAARLPLSAENAGRLRLELWAHLENGARERCFDLSIAQARIADTTVSRVPKARAVRALVDPLAAAVGERLLRPGLRGAFESLLRAVAGDELAKHAPALYTALREECRAAGEGPLALRRALKTRSFSRGRAPPPPARTASRRRLLFVSGMFPSVDHGGGLRLFDLLTELGARHEIDLYSVYREDLDRPSLDALAGTLGAARLVQSDDLGAADVEAWLARLGRGPEYYDAIHFEYPQSAHLISTLRRYGRRTLFTMMECVTRSSLLDLQHLQPARLGEAGPAARALVTHFQLERAALAECDTGIAVTDVDADFAARAFGVQRPQVIHTCVSERTVPRPPASAKPPGPASLGRAAAFVGYFDHRPNRDALVWYLREIHSLVRAKLPDYRFHIIGRGDLSGIREFHAGDPSIVQVGPVSDLAGAIAAARVGLAPLVSGAGIRGKLNQYSAVGRPSVSTRLGAAGLPYENERSILLADSPAAFADAVVRLLTDDELWLRLCAGAQRIVEEQFRWPATVRSLEALYG